MAKGNDFQDGGLMLCDTWKLWPMGDGNWELCHKHVVADKPMTRANGSAGKLMWVRCGRFYQRNTIEHAVLYVADALLKDKARDEVLTLGAALAEYRAICDQLADAVRAWRP